MDDVRSGSGSGGGKPFDIDKQLFVAAWERVKANKGGPGVDGVTIEVFEEDLRDNLYRLWNRMSSGTYFPDPVKGVPIPKGDGGTRLLGVPTVADRVAQNVVVLAVGGEADELFVEDSFGFRPGRGALDAVERARHRCWELDWVVDLDIAKFFDSVAHDTLMRVVEGHRWPRWAVICVRRWITAPMVMPDGTRVARERGTPQGGPVSPLLANMYLDEAFDQWMAQAFPEVPFERYADDAICHCRTRRQAAQLVEALRRRLDQYGLTLHPDKTKIVYCKDSRRTGRPDGAHTKFVFLGFEFRARTAMGRHGRFDSFSPAVDPAKVKQFKTAVKAWRLWTWTTRDPADLVRWVNRRTRGWIAYYGRFFPSALVRALAYLNWHLFKWARRRWGKLNKTRAGRRWRRVTTQHPNLFYHWKITPYAWA